MAKVFKSISVEQSARELLRRICRIHYRSAGQQIAFWSVQEASKLGIMDQVLGDQPPPDTGASARPWGTRDAVNRQ